MTYFCICDDTLSVCDGLMDNRGLAYGDGFFSTLGVHGGQILWQSGHQARLEISALRLSLAVDTPAIMSHLSVLAQKMGEGILKIIITRTPQNVRGYGYHDGGVQIFVKCQAMPIYQNVPMHDGIPYQKSGVAVRLLERVSPRTPRFAGLKLISSHEQVFIHHELQRHQQKHPQVVEGLVQNLAGEWVCGAMGNLFYHLGGNWYTPPVATSGVSGVAREVLMAKFGIGERVFCADELQAIDGLFFCNAVKGVIGIDGLLIDDKITPLCRHILP